MRRGVLLAIALTVLVAALLVGLLAFPTRYGCSDGEGTFTTSAAVAEASCGSTASRLPTGPAVISDRRTVPRAVIALIGVAVLLVLFRFLSPRGTAPDLPDTWRPYG